jgi:hypothetical protein
MLLKRKPKKLSSKHVERATGKHELYCSECDSNPAEVSLDVGKYTCSYCVQKMVAPPENYNKKKDNEGFPRGWHFKKRFEGPDGKIYSFGKIVEDGEGLDDESSEPAEVTPVVKKKRGRPKKDTSTVATPKVTRRKKGSKKNT